MMPGTIVSNNDARAVYIQILPSPALRVRAKSPLILCTKGLMEGNGM